jgi:hypothetical protein
MLVASEHDHTAPPRPGRTRLVSHAARLCTLSAEPGAAPEVGYLHSAYLPTEDTCFCLFQATTADAVRALNDEAGFALDRITAAILLYPASPAPGQPRKDQSDRKAPAADQFQRGPG